MKKYPHSPKKVGKKNYLVPVGGDKRDRTADLLNAIQAPSQHTQKRTLQYNKYFLLSNMLMPIKNS